MSAASPGSPARSPGAVQTIWARRIAESLVDAGVAAVFVSPGSRSTPLVLALDELGPRLPLHVIIDERVAGFAALGLARASGRPVALQCTSGTAAAHYFPAIIEAAQARIPLVAITADRPPELHGASAPQTIDQTRLYGGFTRAFIDLGPPDGAALSQRALRRRVVQAVAASVGPEPGPVQLNVPLRKPLEPASGRGGEASADARADELAPAAPPRLYLPRRRADDAALAALAARIAATPRGLIVAGPMPIHIGALAAAVRRLASVTGFPLCAEATSQLRFTAGRDDHAADGVELLLADPAWRAALAPELVIELGAPPTSAVWAEAAADGRCERWSIAEHGWNDPTSRAASLVLGELTDALLRLADLVAATPSPMWLKAWRAGDATAQRAIEAELGRGAAETPLGELAAVAAAIGALPAGSLLTVGNSLPVRTIDLCVRRRVELAIAGQRGASGIDGLIAGAAGAALGPGASPTALLIGDVSFAHDVGGLAAARLARRPLAIIAIDNGGGRLFEQLPIAGAVDAARLERLWITPPALELAAAAAAFRIPYAAPTSVAELQGAVRSACDRAGASVIHVRVGTSSARDARHRLAAALAADPPPPELGARDHLTTGSLRNAPMQEPS